jgi:hypothetical protein
MATGYRRNRKMHLRQSFIEAVKCYFRFLETDFDFTLTSTKPPFVIYGSPKLQVLVYYEAEERHELDLRITTLEENPRRTLTLGIGMLIRFKEGLNTSGYNSPFPSTQETVDYEVKRLAELTQTYGAEVLGGDLRDFDRMQQLEMELAKKFGSQNRY